MKRDQHQTTTINIYELHTTKQQPTTNINNAQQQTPTNKTQRTRSTNNIQQRTTHANDEQRRSKQATTNNDKQILHLTSTER